MRISILSHATNSFAEIYARGFRDRGHEVQFLSLEDRPLEIRGVEVQVVAPPGFRPRESSTRVPYLAALRPTRKALRSFQPDLLFALFLSSAGIVARLARHPRTVVSAVGSDVYLHRNGALWRSVFRWLAAGTARVHAVSDPLRDVLVDEMHIPESKVFVCPLGIDTADIPTIPFDQRPREGRILVTRGHHKVYDQETVLGALARLKAWGVRAQVTFAHAGAGVERTRRAVEQSGLADRVRFVSGYTLDELPALLADCDVYVSSSLHDGTSTSLLEAQCSGTPVVVSDIPANHAWVRHEREGILFPPGDPEALALSLRRILDDPELGERIGTAGRRIVLVKGERGVLLDRLLEVFASLF